MEAFKRSFGELRSRTIYKLKDVFNCCYIALLLPEGYRRFASHEALTSIKDFARSHPVLRYEYRIDRGSCLRLLDRIESLKEQNIY